MSRLVATAFLTAGVFTFSTLTLPQLWRAENVRWFSIATAVHAAASVPGREIPAQNAVTSQASSIVLHDVTATDVPKQGTLITVSKTAYEELKRTQERNRRLEALVIVLRQRKSEKANVGRDSTEDLDVRLVSNLQR